MTSTHTNLLLAGFLAATLVWEAIEGAYSDPGARRELRPNLASVTSYFMIRSLYFAAVMAFLALAAPRWRGAFSAYPVIPVALGAMFVDDFLNYWVHRFAHKIPWLWRLHKPHHALEHLNATATISGNILYSFVLPSSTIMPLLFFLGAPEAGLILSTFKTLSGITSHSSLRWDLWLRRWTPTRWLMNGLERIFVLQDFHHAHHGIGRDGNSAGNFGNVFSVFDWLYGTGRQPHAVQQRFGLPDDVAVEPWYVRVWWPIFRTRERADLRVLTEEAVRYSSIEIAAAPAVIFTADDRAIPVAHAIEGKSTTDSVTDSMLARA
ncbi:sterol desaturase family protein [Burkholderia sp. R-69980]|nr:sterol desaturase family protein [Burkholderia sp. R-69980]MCI0152025.1 sterol desaturase family protein [Paraburkholderia sediminicola]